MNVHAYKPLFDACDVCGGAEFDPVHTPPMDFPKENNWAVTRSVGQVIRWNERVWSWDGKAWVADTPGATAGQAESGVSLDDPENALGREERRSVTLSEIIDRARHVLAAEQLSERPATAEVLECPRNLVSDHFNTDGVIYQSSFIHVQREAMWEHARQLAERGQGEGSE